MKNYDFDRLRYRTLVYALWLQAALGAGGASVALMMPQRTGLEWLAFAADGVLCLSLLPLARHAYQHGRRAWLEWIGLATVLMGSLLVMQRIIWVALGPMWQDPAINVFRPIFAFLPFVYVAAVALLRARQALLLSWMSWGLISGVTVAGLYLHTGLDPQRDGASVLLLWLLLGNPLLILLLHALPPYEDWLESAGREVVQLRERAELVEKLAESERRFNLVIESLHVGVWDLWIGPPERRWWSPRFYELIGYTPEELPASEQSMSALIHDDERDAARGRALQQLMRGDFCDVEFRLKTKHAGYRWFHSHAKAERDAQGRVIRVVGALSDIHDQRMAELALREAQAELTRLAYLDPLTSLNNRRGFDERFVMEWPRSARRGHPLSLLLIDLDHFKAYNDHYGHSAGDRCLSRVAECLRDCARRPADFVARVGGEEFALLLPDTPPEGALVMANKIMDNLRALDLRHTGSPQLRVTASIGAATRGPGDEERQSLYDRADAALYQVKHAGRNAVRHHPAPLGKEPMSVPQ